MTQVPKKKNHEVTKGYLKRWVNQVNQLWVFDIETQKIESRSLEAKFAIQDYLYVPEISGQRVDATEEWFAGAENELVRFINRVDTKDYTTPIKGNHLYLTILGLIGLSLRSAYDLQSIDAQLLADPTLQEKLGVDVSTETARHRFIVENMIAVINRAVERFCQANVTIVFGTKTSILTCDRPGADQTFMDGGMHFIPLGPHDYVFMDLSRPPPAITSGVMFAPSGPNEEIIRTINNQIISRARRWIVAKSKEELEAIALEITPEKIKKRILSDKKEFVGLSEEERRWGWKLKDPSS